MPTVSVIIPTFNRAYCLERALLSVINQTHPITEIIIVDDGSNDRTEQILYPYKNQITLIKQNNHGVSHARNTGIKRAHSDWIALLDSDDAWQTNKLEQQFSQLSQQKRLISHTDEIWIRNNRRVNPKKIHQKQGGWIFENCLPLCAISPSSVVIHKKVFQQVGLFDESLPACEDG